MNEGRTYSHRPPARTFVPVAILNAIMLIAIPFAGHHYLIDVIAGASVALLSIMTVQSVTGTIEVKSAADWPARGVAKA